MSRTWRSKVLTLFPEMFPGPLGMSLAGRGLNEGIWSLETKNIRDHGNDRHASVDDPPFGGGHGMVMRPDVIDRALSELLEASPNLPLVATSPRGAPLNQARVRKFAAGPGLIILCGRFEGIDQRVIEAYDMEEISVSDVILSGGETAAFILLDACVRLLDGIIGKPESAEDESFESGLLEYPHYTRPHNWKGRRVPTVLMSGHHENIRKWRQAEAESITKQRRPDLWSLYQIHKQGKTVEK